MNDNHYTLKSQRDAMKRRSAEKYETTSKQRLSNIIKKKMENF